MLQSVSWVTSNVQSTLSCAGWWAHFVVLHTVHCAHSAHGYWSSYYEGWSTAGGQRQKECCQASKEFYAVYAYTDVSAAKMNTFRSLSSSQQFNHRDLAEFTCVQTMESRIMRIIFPGGHRTRDLTRNNDGKKLILHYIPYVEAVKRILRTRMLDGHIYTRYEVEMSPRNPANRGMGRANSGTWFQGAQIRAQRLVLEAGKGCDVRVAGLLTASDATYGLKNMPWHGMYGKAWSCKHICIKTKKTDLSFLHSQPFECAWTNS